MPTTKNGGLDDGSTYGRRGILALLFPPCNAKCHKNHCIFIYIRITNSRTTRTFGDNFLHCGVHRFLAISTPREMFSPTSHANDMTSAPPTLTRTRMNYRESSLHLTNSNLDLLSCQMNFSMDSSLLKPFSIITI